MRFFFTVEGAFLIFFTDPLIGDALADLRARRETRPPGVDLAVRIWVGRGLTGREVSGDSDGDTSFEVANDCAA